MIPTFEFDKRENPNINDKFKCRGAKLYNDYLGFELKPTIKYKKVTNLYYWKMQKSALFS